MNNTMSIFDYLYPKYKITKPIRLIEFFAGYGSQALALKYLGVPFEHWKICEWAVKSIQAYKDIHFTDDDIDYLALQPYSDKEKWLTSWLFEKGISSNYNEPMTKQQIMRLSETQKKTIFNNICATHNLVNIQQVKGEDLEIVDTDKYDYILTYSFPCQDLSLAGKGKGMSDTTTRSGMLWEVERILTECYELETMPQILLMENVPQVHSQDNLEDFNKWKLRLEELGYKNYFQDLIATDYGIPQTRNRCFMISILGEYSYTFPKPIPLEKKLKDILEYNVDEKYFLSDKMKQYIFSEDDKYKVNKNSLKLNREIACSKTTREGWTRADTSNYISEDVKENYDLKCFHKTLRETLESNNIEEGVNYIDAYNRKIDNSGMAKTISTRVDASNNTYIAIKNATKQGYLEATDGDGIDLAMPNSETRRGRVQKDSIQTLTTQNNLGVVVDTLKKDLCNKLIREGLVEEGDVVKHSYTSQILDGNKKCVEKNDGNMITLTTRGDCVGTAINDNGNLRIRKLTPKECFRLMGVKDEDFENCAKNQSDSSLYHLAGDSIVVNVLMAIFKELI